MRRTAGNGENGIRWRFPFKPDDLDFADDIALISSTKQQIRIKQQSWKKKQYAEWGSRSVQERKVVRINARNQDKIVVNEIADIWDVDEFTYFGGKVGEEGCGMKDLKKRQSKARGAFIRLKNMWRSHSISRKKLRPYNDTGGIGIVVF